MAVGTVLRVFGAVSAIGQAAVALDQFERGSRAARDVVTKRLEAGEIRGFLDADAIAEEVVRRLEPPPEAFEGSGFILAEEAARLGARIGAVRAIAGQ